jgi:hypothetical protein
MKSIHNRSPNPPTGTAKPLKGCKKRKNSTGEIGASKKSPTTASASFEKLRDPVCSTNLSEQYQHGYQQLMPKLMDFPDLGDVEAGEQKIEKGYFRWSVSQPPSPVHNPAGSGYQEIIFDSNSAHSSSIGSACSGRSRPPDKVAFAAMRLVKAVGACWKCKFLRKKVNVTAPFNGGVNL